MMFDDAYIKWKGWTSTGGGQTELAYYRKIVNMLDVGPDSEVLEVGYGNGSFLTFGSGFFKKIIGLEINPSLISKFTDIFEVHDVRWLDSDSGFYDLIILFDVLEHIDRSELIGFIDKLKQRLKPGGKIVARFPNGDSPLGFVNYNSDLTHKTNIGSGIIRHIASVCGLKVAYAGPDPVPIWGCKSVTAIHRILVFPLLRLTDLLFKIVYMKWDTFGVSSINAFVVLKFKI